MSSYLRKKMDSKRKEVGMLEVVSVILLLVVVGLASKQVIHHINKIET